MQEVPVRICGQQEAEMLAVPGEGTVAMEDIEDLQVALVPAGDRADRQPEPVDDQRAPRGPRQRVVQRRRMILEGTPSPAETLMAEQIRIDLEEIDQVPAGLDRDLQPRLVGQSNAELLGRGEVVHGARPGSLMSPCWSTRSGADPVDRPLHSRPVPRGRHARNSIAGVPPRR
jgi:hypothetical protein